LVKEMERVGIGRPSTYAATLQTLFQREYVREEKKRLRPSSRGFAADGLLMATFEGLVTVEYTAEMEKRLDLVAAGKSRWKDDLREWYGAFAPQLTAAGAKTRAWLQAHPEQARPSPATKRAGRQCPLCKKHELVVRDGKNGPFASCPGFRDTPKCEYLGAAEAVPWEGACPKCQGPLEVSPGTRGGRWVRCARPGCRAGFDPDQKPHDAPCPVCQGPMVAKAYDGRRYARCTREGCKGSLDLSPALSDMQCPACFKAMRDKGAFYGCSGYPSCKTTIDKAALEDAKTAKRTCRHCGSWLVRKKVPGKEPFYSCVAFRKCGHSEQIPPEEKKRPRAAKRPTPRGRA
jgi:DNA topoisomerase-1